MISSVKRQATDGLLSTDVSTLAIHSDRKAAPRRTPGGRQSARAGYASAIATPSAVHSTGNCTLGPARTFTATPQTLAATAIGICTTVSVADTLISPL